MREKKKTHRTLNYREYPPHKTVQRIRPTKFHYMTGPGW